MLAQASKCTEMNHLDVYSVVVRGRKDAGALGCHDVKGLDPKRLDSRQTWVQQQNNQITEGAGSLLGEHMVEVHGPSGRHIWSKSRSFDFARFDSQSRDPNLSFIQRWQSFWHRGRIDQSPLPSP